MKFSLLMAASLPFLTSALAGVKSGHAEAELVSGPASYKAGQPVAVGIKLKFDAGWHGYWINPGEAGMPLSAKWTLPVGWKAGELRNPVPKRFKTGELSGFGYEGEAVYLVDLTPPATADGDAECKVKLSWLTCNDSACVPGDVELSLKLPAGDGAAGPRAEAIAAAERKMPAPAKDASLTLRESGNTLILTLTGPESLDLTGARAFPATPQVVADSADLVFQRKEGAWVAEAPKNEYAEGEIALLDIVIHGGKVAEPISVTWRAAR